MLNNSNFSRIAQNITFAYFVPHNYRNNLNIFPNKGSLVNLNFINRLGKKPVNPTSFQHQKIRKKRIAEPDPRHVRTDRQYLLSIFLKQKAMADIAIDEITDEQLAIRLLRSLDQQPGLMPELARLALYDNRFYGERRGETLGLLQQKSLIGQMRCQLIYKEESIALHVVVNTHLRGAFFLTQAIAVRMLARPRAEGEQSIIFITSCLAQMVSTNRLEY